MVAGSNPNLDRSGVKYQTEYRVEYFKAPWMDYLTRPNVTGVPGRMDYGKVYQVRVDLGDTTPLKNLTVKGSPLISFLWLNHINSPQ
jgi:hypothetical protein